MSEIKVLAMGAVVKVVQDLENDYMIIARTIVNNNGKNSVKYILLNYPYGGDSGHAPVTIDENDITETIFSGYSDAKDEAYIQELFLEAGQPDTANTLENLEIDDSEPQVSGNNETNTVSPVVPEKQANGDPFYKFREVDMSEI